MGTSDLIYFSVVIPTYNRADLILETLDTVLGQSYSHYEILVVDNCSTDNTESVLQPLIEAKKVRYIRNEKNYERAYSRNVGFENAKGDFLTLLDSDDFMYPDNLRDAAEFISRNPELKVFQNKFEFVNNNRERIYSPNFPSLKNQYKALCSGNFMSAIGGFIHRDVYTKFWFSLDPKMIGTEDFDFWFNVFANYKVGRIDKVNSGVREHPNRSVNIDAYKHIKYQSAQIVSKIKADPLLNEKFGKYTGRLSASYNLQEMIANRRVYPVIRKIKLLIEAAKNDISIIFTRRYLAATKNIFK